jgi:hypothetical protein
VSVVIVQSGQWEGKIEVCRKLTIEMGQRYKTSSLSIRAGSGSRLCEKPECPHVPDFTFVIGSQIVVKKPSTHYFPQIIQSWRFTNAMFESWLTLQPESIFLPQYRRLRRFRGSSCHSAHQNNLLDLTSDEIALSGSQQLPTLYQYPPDIFEPVLCESQIISQIIVGLCDQSMFTIEVAILSIRKASLSSCVVTIHQSRPPKSISVQHSRLPPLFQLFTDFEFRQSQFRAVFSWLLLSAMLSICSQFLLRNE